MTCKDCLHWEACLHLIEAMNHDYKGKNITIKSVCKKFKNKYDYAEVKHGEWIEIIKDIGKGRTLTHYKCSLCGVHINDKSNYCYHCGAKMDGGKEE